MRFSLGFHHKHEGGLALTFAAQASQNPVWEGEGTCGVCSEECSALALSPISVKSGLRDGKGTVVQTDDSSLRPCNHTPLVWAGLPTSKLHVLDCIDWV